MICNVKSKMNTATVRNVHWEGKDYLAVPMVMLKEHVLNGSHGATFYNAAEVSKNPTAWNMKPVVVYHPVRAGKSATDTLTYEKQGIGMIMNTTWEDGKLKAEAWIDKEKANRVDSRVMEAVTSGNILEVSTGHYGDLIQKSGVFANKEYTQQALNIVPDHLAVLPDKPGALSVEEGAGLLRNQNAEEVESQDVLENSDADDSLPQEVTEMAESPVEAVEPQVILNSLEDIYAHCEGGLKEIVKEAFDLLQNEQKEMIELIVENSDFVEDDFVGRSPSEIRKLASLVRNTAAKVAEEVEAEEVEAVAEEAVAEEVVAEEVVENEGCDKEGCDKEDCEGKEDCDKEDCGKCEDAPVENAVKPKFTGQAGVAPVENAKADVFSDLIPKPLF